MVIYIYQYFDKQFVPIIYSYRPEFQKTLKRMIEIGMCIIASILYLVLIYNVLCPSCSANERTLTSCSDVETPLLFSQVNTENNPRITPLRNIASQIAEDEVNTISEEHLDDNNNQAFPVTTPLRNRPSYEPIFQDYACKIPYHYSSSLHNLIDS